MSSVLKSIAVDFGGVEPNIGKLQGEINLATNIDPTCLYINMYGDTVEIVFDGILSPTGEAALDDVIAAHDPSVAAVYSKNIGASLSSTKTKNSVFTKIGTIVFPGASEMRVKGVGFIDAGATSYTVRLVGQDSSVIAEATFTNTVSATIDLGTVNSVPADISMLTVMLKRNGGNATLFANLEALYIYYN